MLYRFIFYLLERATSAGSQSRHCIKSSRLPVKYSGFALRLLISEEPVNSISMRSSSSACKIISAAASSPLFTCRRVLAFVYSRFQHIAGHAGYIRAKRQCLCRVQAAAYAAAGCNITFAAAYSARFQKRLGRIKPPAV